MKKFTLFAIALLASVVSFAALNPYAYGLSSTLDGTTLTVNYSLNAPATAVSVVIMDGETEVKTIDCDGITKDSHSVDISTLDLPTGKFLTWKVVVSGNSVASPTLQSDLTLKYSLPRGIGVDRSTESPYFGRIYTTDATGGSAYHASEGKGLYVFDAGLTPITSSTGGKKFTGGITFGSDDISRVVVSDDGRVFLSRFNTTGSPILEVNPANLNENFKNVFTSITGSAIGIDVKGAGDNLQLVMLSKTDRVITEYDLKTASQWTSSTPSRTYTKKDLTTGKTLSLVTDNAYISYDLNDGVWLTQHRATATTTEPTIAHVIPSGMDYNNFNAGLSHNGTSNGGIAISPDGKLLAVVGAGTQKLTIYSVSRDNGDIALTSKYTISTSGSNHTALEWDYAGNLYVANRSAETITFYAMPYSGMVATPAASKYTFHLGDLPPEYTITATANNETMGTVSGARKYYKGETVTLKATPKTGHEFVDWSNGSTDNPMVFTATEDVELTANFKALQYTVTVGVNNETMGSVTNAGEHTLDYGTELVLKATSNAGYRFVKWSTGATANPLTTTVTGDAEIIAQFELAPVRAWAYDLEMEVEDKAYTFTFKATTIANATLVFTNAEGAETGTMDLGTVAIGVNTKTLAADEIPGAGEIHWAVKLAGEAIENIAETTDQSRGIYDFYTMRGVVVDNDPNSKDFAKIYVEMSLNGADDGSTTRAKTQKAGIFIYDQQLNELNTPSNVGYKPTLPSEYTELGTKAEAMKRLAIDPTNGNLAFGNNISGEGSVWSISRDNLNGAATNIIEGATGIDKVNAICYDENGVLYVLANINTGYTKFNFYKFTDGVQTELTLGGEKIFVDAEVSMASDGRGGIWIAQNRSGIGDYKILSHVNVAEDKLDFVVETDKDYSDWFGGNCYRSAVAYNPKDNVLAVQGISKVSLFSVSYDSAGVPSISKLAQTPIVGKNIDGLAFDYAGDLYVVNSSNEKFQKFVVPTNNNTCTTPAPKSQVITKPSNPTVLDNTVVAPQVEKIVRNGQVLIIRDGKTFNMMGQEVK